MNARFTFAFMTALVAIPCRASDAADSALNRAYAVIKERRLITPHELACSTFVSEGNEAGVSTIAVREKHGGRCRGDPEVAPIRFRMEVDRAGKRVLWDRNSEMEMRPVPSAPAKRR